MWTIPLSSRKSAAISGDAGIQPSFDAKSPGPLLHAPVHSSALCIRTGTTLSCWCTRCWHGSQLCTSSSQHRRTGVPQVRNSAHSIDLVQSMLIPSNSDFEARFPASQTPAKGTIAA
eukprot:482423-Rhodomonas_salina.1